MKKLIITICIFITALSCKAQIIPVEEHKNYLESENEIPKGSYIQDVNNLLDKYIGTWVGTYDNKTFEVIINEITVSFLKITVDELQLRYKITDNDENIIADTTNEPDDSYLIVSGKYLTRPNLYVMTYIGEEGNCGQDGDLLLGIPDNSPNTMNVFYAVSRDIILRSDCPNGLSEQILPTEQFTLTRQ